MHRTAWVVIASALIVAAAPSRAADADAGKQKAEPCMSCHFVEDFAGKTPDEILALITTERTQVASGTHPPVFEGLSDTDLADIAAYLSRGQ